MPSPHTLGYQFHAAQDALREAENLARRGYWGSCISQAYQAVLHGAAGLLYGVEVWPRTEREVRIAFAGAFVSTGRCEARFDQAFRALERLRQNADFDPEHTASADEADRALRIAREFHAEALRLQKEVLK